MKVQPMSVLDVLALAHAYLEHGWCQHWLALRQGKPVFLDDPQADQWCAMGALRVAVAQVAELAEMRQSELPQLEDAAARLLIDATRVGTKGGYDMIDRQCVVDVNNHPRQTVAGVQAIFEEAAQKVGKG